ncbi:MAG: response regulator [Candidatus Riflebacteria bacterium]|nr:response regulator [Candidatus Riflebacteria bacterium]
MRVEPGKILVVEDDEDIRSYLQDVLMLEGYLVEKASSGQDALRKVETFAPDLLLLDLMLPDISGEEICKNLKNDPEKSDIKIFMLTAKSSVEEKIKGFKAGADDYLGKPFSTEELLARIAVHFRLIRLKKTLAFSENRHRTLLENLPDAVLLLSGNNLVCSANSKIFSLLKLPSTLKLEGMNLDELSKLSPLFEKIKQLVKKAKYGLTSVSNYDEYSQIIDGVEHFFEISALPIQEAVCDEKAIQILVRDVTEKKAIDKMLEKIEKINSLEILANGVAHEINNPLAGIANALKLIQKKSLSEDKQNALFEQASESIKRIKNITKDLTFFVQQEKADVSSFSIQEATSDAVSFIGYQKGGKEVDLMFEFSEEPLRITGSRSSYVQLMLNLLLNSIQAIEEKGKINVYICEEPEGVARVSVKDSGCGIPHKELEFVFDPFFSIKKNGIATGLGLTVARKIIRLFQGSIEVTSAQGEGTEIVMLFPITEKVTTNN